MSTGPDPGAAFEPFIEEIGRLLPAGATVWDAHTHLGVDEDGMRLSLAELLELLDLAGEGARACVFPLHDPGRRPGYRVPNDRVLDWAQQTGGRLVPFCRLDPGEDPVGEAERALARGAKGIKLHPRAQAFGFGDGAAESIFAVAAEHGVPILIHAGRGMPTMAPLAELALRRPEVTLILAHAAIADQGLLTSRLREHPRVLYDTSCFFAPDVVELFARVPAERIVFASDPPYGRPMSGLFLALRAAALAGVDERGRALVAGGTIEGLITRGELPDPRQPRLAPVRPLHGTLLRVLSYLTMAFGGAMAEMPPRAERALAGVALARAVCREPDAGPAEPVLERIDQALAAAEALLAAGGPAARAAVGLVHGSIALAATEPIGAGAQLMERSPEPLSA